MKWWSVREILRLSITRRLTGLTSYVIHSWAKMTVINIFKQKLAVAEEIEKLQAVREYGRIFKFSSEQQISC